MKGFKKLAALMLALTMMLGLLTACGGGGTSDPQSTPGFVYVPAYSELKSDLKIQYINSSCWRDGKIYFMASVVTGQETYTPDPASSGTDVVEPRSTDTLSASSTDVAPAAAVDGEPTDGSYTYDVYRTGLFSMNEDGSEVTEIPNYVLPEADPNGQSGTNVNGMTVDPSGNIWVAEYSYTSVFDPPEGVDENSPEAGQYYTYSETYALRKLDPTGTELKNVDLSFMKGDSEYFYMNGVMADKAGNIYIVNGNNATLYVLDSEGNQLFSVAGENGGISNTICLADGTVAVLGWDQATGKSTIRKVDTAAKALSAESFDAPVNGYNFYTGSGDYDFYYNTESSLFGYKLASAESEKLITWINSDVDSNGVGNIMPLSDGRIMCTYSDYTSPSPSTQLLTLTRTAASEVTQKKVLTYACMYLDWNVRSEIIKFNKTNPDYRI